MLKSTHTSGPFFPFPIRHAIQDGLDALSRRAWQIADALFLGAGDLSYASRDDPCFMADPLAHPDLKAMDERMLGDLPFDASRIRDTP